MIDFFSSWSEQIIVAIIVSSIIEMILPNNKNKKYIKMVIGIYVLFTIISPIANKKDVFNLEKNLNIESYAATEDNTNIKEEVNQESMDERLQELYIKELENNIKTKVEQEGYIVASCRVDAVLYGDIENQEVRSIDLVVSKQTNQRINEYDNNKSTKNTKEKSNIKSINKVQISVGLDRILKNDNEIGNKENVDIQNLKDSLSSYYEIDSKKININLK